MSEKKYLDYEGLQDVAGKVNTRLKTVTEMSSSASEGAVRLYVGETDTNYTKGHTYQSSLFYEWRYAHAFIFTKSATPVVGEAVYNYKGIQIGTLSAVSTGQIEFNGTPYTSSGSTVSRWIDLTPIPNASGVAYDNTESGLASSNVQNAIDEVTKNMVSFDEFATAFSTSVRYCYGDIVYKDSKLYICTTDYTLGSWSESHWTEILKIFDSLNYRLLQCKSIPYWNYDFSKNGIIIQYVGATSTNYKNGHFYKYNSATNRWDEFQLQEMDSTLSETSTNGIQNQAVTRAISDAESNANAYTRAMIAESITNVLSQEF